MFTLIKSRVKKFVQNQIDAKLSTWVNENSILNKGFIDPSAKIAGSKIHGNINIGYHSQISYAIIAGSDIKIGKYSSINGPNTTIYSELNPISIGNFTSIARNVDIQEWNHPTTRTTSYPVKSRILGKGFIDDIESKGAISIGNDVWIGAQSLILSGAEISDGCIVAANTVVTGYLPPFSIVAGSPAKIIKYRFKHEIIEAFLKVKWWEWSEQKIHSNSDLFEFDWKGQEEVLLKKLHEKISK